LAYVRRRRTRQNAKQGQHTADYGDFAAKIERNSFTFAESCHAGINRKAVVNFAVPCEKLARLNRTGRLYGSKGNGRRGEMLVREALYVFYPDDEIIKLFGGQTLEDFLHLLIFSFSRSLFEKHGAKFQMAGWACLLYYHLSERERKFIASAPKSSRGDFFKLIIKRFPYWEIGRSDYLTMSRDFDHQIDPSVFASICETLRERSVGWLLYGFTLNKNQNKQRIARHSRKAAESVSSELRSLLNELESTLSQGASAESLDRKTAIFDSRLIYIVGDGPGKREIGGRNRRTR
jgi:hypothetical protein